MNSDCTHPAFGSPGMAPRWTRGAKDAVGTALSTSSYIWFTLAQGILTEVYYPTIDRPQLRDLQYLVTDGRTFFHEERRNLISTVEPLAASSLGFRIVTRDHDDRYSIEKELICAPYEPCLLMRTALHSRERLPLRMFVLCAPHLNVGGWHNNGRVINAAGRKILVAWKESTWMALAASAPFRRTSCGYVATSDGWTDLNSNYQLDWDFDCALDGNIALTGELAVQPGDVFTLALSFGPTLQSCVNSLMQCLGLGFNPQKQRFLEQWERRFSGVLPLHAAGMDGGRLFERSVAMLFADEDKSYPGAMIASMSIPWGEIKGDEELGGYHLVWTRDLVNSAGGLMSAGILSVPLRALIYLATSQRDDGGFYQNFWIDGTPYWNNVQLDEVAFPILLAWRLDQAGALGDFDPFALVLQGARFLIANGPITAQDRWEEASGYSPSTLAAEIAALICAASYCRERGDVVTAEFLEEYADFLEMHVEAWTVTTEGTLVPGISRHYIRIHPLRPGAPDPDEDPNHGILCIANATPGEQSEFPAKEIVDQGFLELVRYGIRRAGDPLIEDSLRVIDATLKIDLPAGPCWRRYNHDGYGQRRDGTAWDGWGVGRVWPLLTGERGHYELAAGRDARPYLRAMEGFAHGVGLLAEQLWDDHDIPEQFMFIGKPTGSAMPLMWAHAEYLKLLRSVRDGAVFDRIACAADRYLTPRRRKKIEIWSSTRAIGSVAAGVTLRVLATESFSLRWTANEWQNINETPSRTTALGIHFADLEVPPGQRAPLRFLFRHPDRTLGPEEVVRIKP
jgi:glucoamylase